MRKTSTRLPGKSQTEKDQGPTHLRRGSDHTACRMIVYTKKQKLTSDKEKELDLEKIMDDSDTLPEIVLN